MYGGSDDCKLLGFAPKCDLPVFNAMRWHNNLQQEKTNAYFGILKNHNLKAQIVS